MFYDIFVFRFAKIWQTTETYSPQTFSVTAAVVAPAVAICLNSLKKLWELQAPSNGFLCPVASSGLELKNQ